MQSKALKLRRILLIGILFISACRQNSSQVRPNQTPTLDSFLTDSSILTDIPCEAPCWYGLELNESTRGDVFTVLQGLTFISQNTVQETLVGYWDPIVEDNIPAKLISANCIQPEDRQCVGLTIADDRLKIIGLFPNYEIRFDELVNHLSAPDYVSINLIPPIHSPGCSVSLIWVEQRIIVDHTEKSDSTLCDDVHSGTGIKPFLSVNSITYFLPEYIELRIESSETYPWSGFAEP